MTGSAIYEGWVAHRRFGAVPHSFRYRVFMPLFDLDELPGVLDPIPLWSARRPAPARFREADHLPGGERAPGGARTRPRRRPVWAGGRGPRQAAGQPALPRRRVQPGLVSLPPWRGGGLDSVIAEVTNTPWRERTDYVLDAQRAASERHVIGTFQKRMHVSPFQPMEQTYEISVTRPDERFGVVIRNLERGRPVFVASMALRRHEITRGRMLRLLLGYPPMTIATLARIYANALRLKLRGARFHPHPEVRADEQAVRVSELARRRRGDHVAGGARLRDHDETAGRRRRQRPRGCRQQRLRAGGDRVGNRARRRPRPETHRISHFANDHVGRWVAIS